jgi:hypothetical protein
LRSSVSGVGTVELGKAIRSACGISRRLVMSDSDVRKAEQLAELKKKIDKELSQLMKQLKAGTIDRKKLESGLKKVKMTVREIPWFRK